MFWLSRAHTRTRVPYTTLFRSHRRGGDVPLRFVDRERAARRDPGGLRDDGLRRSAAVIVGGSAARIDARHSRRAVLHPLDRGQRGGGSEVPAVHADKEKGGEVLLADLLA